MTGDSFQVSPKGRTASTDRGFGSAFNFIRRAEGREGSAKPDSVSLSSNRQPLLLRGRSGPCTCGAPAGSELLRALEVPVVSAQLGLDFTWWS